MLIRVWGEASHVSFHTDFKDFKDVGFADYARRLSTVLYGPALRYQPPEWQPQHPGVENVKYYCRNLTLGNRCK
mgnify:FL=1